MTPNLRIALRFLTARRRAMFMSLFGIMFGVGFFVVTQAQTSGFEGFFIKTILGTNGALRIEDRLQATLFPMEADGPAGRSDFLVASDGNRKVIPGIADPVRIGEAVRHFKNVSGVSIVLEGSANLATNVSGATVRVQGMNISDHLAVSDLAGQIVQGDLSDFRVAPTGAVVGSVLAARHNLHPGDSFTLEWNGAVRRYRVSALYETGVSDIDKVRLYVHLAEARSLFQKPTGASFLQVNLFDPGRAREDAARIQEVIGHAVAPWQRREKTWLDVFRALRLSSAITVSTIILISGLAMFNTLAMVVMEKTKDIAILRSMGYTRADIARIFIWQGVIVLAAGAIAGCVFGAAATYGVSKVPIRIRGIFSTDSFVVAWSVWHYVAAVGIASVVVMAASLIPARRAARLEPGDVIRGASQ
ncbi:MAG: FtsX-like permease family protein [Opitutaceae bacterium]|jgi:lipoprotein-releasing system permease protein